MSNDVLKRQKGPNWGLIGTIVGFVVIFWAGAAILPPLPPIYLSSLPTMEPVGSLVGYCKDFPERCVVTGNLESGVAFMEISDYGCPHCAEFNKNMTPLLQAEFIDDITWVVMPFALGSSTSPSAAAVFCAADQSQELGMQFHKNVFRLQGSAMAHTPGGFTAVAEQIDGLDVAEFDACVEDGRNLAKVRLNQQAARDRGLQSTPTLFLNDGMIRWSEEELELLQSRIAFALGR